MNGSNKLPRMITRCLRDKLVSKIWNQPEDASGASRSGMPCLSSAAGPGGCLAYGEAFGRESAHAVRSSTVSLPRIRVLESGKTRARAPAVLEPRARAGRGKGRREKEGNIVTAARHRQRHLAHLRLHAALRPPAARNLVAGHAVPTALEVDDVKGQVKQRSLHVHIDDVKGQVKQRSLHVHIDDAIYAQHKIGLMRP
ncbi:hypothetical protein RRG08_027104 [Elysia crispata]|uniref:Uncharacterized protein n=1 Tax=Elysia crispata TaxID=231223 RepID=A0AAE0XY62_9GAST|nr:hypothetical protein RRG08_027104 [Elysia crispata]